VGPKRGVSATSVFGVGPSKVLLEFCPGPSPLKLAVLSEAGVLGTSP
jgi:hypothetical protein